MPRHPVPEENKLNFKHSNNNSADNTNQTEVKEQQPSTKNFRGVCWINRQIILKHPFVVAFSVPVKNSMAKDRATMTSFGIGISMHNLSS